MTNLILLLTAPIITLLSSAYSSNIIVTVLLPEVGSYRLEIWVTLNATFQAHSKLNAIIWLDPPPPHVWLNIINIQ